MWKRIILFLLPLALPLYVVRFHIGPLPTTLLEIVVIISFVYWLVSMSFLRRQESSPVRSAGQGWIPAFARMTKNKWFWPLLLWLTAGAIGVLVAQNHIAALGLWRAYFLEPILVFVMLADIVRTDDDRRILLRSVILITIGVALWSMLQRIGVLTIPTPWNVPPNGIRSTGPFPFPNALALFAVPVSALCFAMVMKKQKSLCYGDLWLWGGFGSGIVATILAKSAGGIIAICAAVFVALILQRKTRLIAIGGAVATILFILAIPSIRIPVTQKIFFDAWSGKVRLVMWKETWTMLRDRPIFGAGLGGYPSAIIPYHKATWMEIFQYPHNIFLNLWSETGLLGFVAFGWILLTWNRDPHRTGVWIYALPIIATLLVHGLVDVPYFKNDLAILFWILVVLTTVPQKQNDADHSFAPSS